MDKYEFVKSIGQGMFGQVFLGKHKEENKYYAIKRINFQDINEKDRKNIENEVLLLKELRHPNIVSYKDSFLDKDNYYNIVMIYCDGGDIYSKIKAAKNKHFSENEILDWLVQICLALSYIHDKKILHRDLKTQNIFIQNENRIRIGDFGIAKIFNQTKEMAGSMIGTPLYMSPEQYKGDKYGYKSDIWSLGCCLFEMCNLKHAFEGNSWNAVVVKVIKGSHQSLNSMYSKEMKNIVESMLALNPKNRLTVASILEKPIMKPRVAAYISDFIQNYKKYDGDEEQCDILREQAEKFGIFNKNMIKEIYIDNDKTMIKDMNDLNSINENEKKVLLDKRDMLENKIKELETSKKAILEKLTKKNGYRKKQNVKTSFSKEKDSRKFGYNMNNDKRVNKNKNIEEYSRLKNKNGMSSQSPQVVGRKGSVNDNNEVPLIEKRQGGAKRPLTSKKDRDNENADNIYVIKEETNNYIAERNKVTKITQEIGKLKKALEQTNNKISEFGGKNGGTSPPKPSQHQTIQVTDQEETGQEPITSKDALLDERINFFKTRCINSLGQRLYKKAYDYIKASKINQKLTTSQIREYLTNLFGKNNIAFWQLIDQIVILEKIKGI